MDPQVLYVRPWRLDRGRTGLAGFAEHGPGDESDNGTSGTKDERRRHAGFDATVEMVA
jgi:hypothetical protein